MRHLVIFQTSAGVSAREVECPMPTKNFSIPETYGLSSSITIIAVVHNIQLESGWTLVSSLWGNDERMQPIMPPTQPKLGYEGGACSSCLNFTLRRAGTCLVCDTCGTTTGCS